MKVSNMKSPRTGRDVPNQFIIVKDDYCGLSTEYFQSYKTIIVKKEYKNVAKSGLKCFISLDETFWNYSKTTSKYRNIFLGETTAETQAKIDSGEYTLTDLN